MAYRLKVAEIRGDHEDGRIILRLLFCDYGNEDRIRDIPGGVQEDMKYVAFDLNKGNPFGETPCMVAEHFREAAEKMEEYFLCKEEEEDADGQKYLQF